MLLQFSLNIDSDLGVFLFGIFHTLYLVGGFNPSEKYWSKWESSPSRDEHKKCLKPPPSLCMLFFMVYLPTCMVDFSYLHAWLIFYGACRFFVLFGGES